MLRPCTQSLTSRKLFISTLTIIGLLAAALLVKGWQPGQPAAAHSLTAPLATPTPATAYPAVDVKVKGEEFPDFALIGEQFCYTALVKNVGGTVGFGPYLQLVLPPGLEFVGAALPGLNSANSAANSSSAQTYPLANPAPLLVGTFDQNSTNPPPLKLEDPVSKQLVMGEHGGQLYIIRLPIGSLYAAEEGIPVKICLKVKDDVPPDVPLTVCHNPVFQYTTASGGAAIFGDPKCPQVTPVVVRLFKLSNAPTSNHELPLPPNETATGACHPLTFELVANIADSKTITSLVFTDTLPNELVLVSSAAAIQSSITGLTNANVTVVGQTITVTGDSAAGTSDLNGKFNERDVSIKFQAYVQNNDAFVCTPPKQVLNVATLNAQYNGNAIKPQSGAAFIDAKHVTLQKYARGPLAPADPVSVMPGDTVKYELHYQISESVSGFLHFRIEDTLPASVNYVPGSATITFGSTTQLITPQLDPVNAGETRLTFMPPLAARAKCSTVIIRYDGKVPEDYNALAIPVLAADEIINKANVFYGLLPGAKTCQDDTGARVIVKPVKIEKTIVNLQPEYEPGDKVTFKLRLEAPSGDTSFVTFTDFLPLPVFQVGTSTNTAALVAQYAINCKLGCGPVDFSQLQVASSAAENSLKFTLKPDVLATPSTAPLIIELEFTIEVTTEPFADDLYLTNIFDSRSYDTYGNEARNLTGVTLHVRAPVLKITKGVSDSDNGGDKNINPKPSTTPINGNLTEADGSDTITFAITVENTGGAPAFDVKLTDVVPNEFTPVAITSVVGVAPVTGPAFTGQTLTATYQNFPPAGKSVIKFTAKLKSNVLPCQTITNTAEVVWASQAGATLFTKQMESATVSIAQPKLTKTILAPALPYKLPIGGKVKYEVKVQIPESSALSITITDLLDPGLAIVDNAVKAVPGSGITILGSDNGVISPTGDKLTFGFGFANFNSDNQARFITFTYEAVVLNTAANQRGVKLNNTVQWVSPSCGTISASAPDLTIIEPTLKVTKTVTPASADAGDELTFTITVMHDGVSDADAYDVILGDNFSGIVSTSWQCTGGGSPTPTQTKCSATATSGSAEWSHFPLGATATITYKAKLSETLKVCGNLTNGVFVWWTSLPGMPGKLSPHNGLAFERTWNSLSDPGGAANDYRANASVSITTPQPTIAKLLKGTSAAHTNGTNVAIGEEVTYDLVVCLPQGAVPGLRVIDQLPPGMEAVSATITATGGIGGLPQPLTVTPGLGATQTFTLGPLSVPVTTSTGLTCFTITLVTRVCDGTMLTNKATVQLFEPSLPSLTLCQAMTESEKLTVVEPKLEVKKEFSPAFAKPGDTVQIKLTLTNNGTADAFGLTVQDVLAANCLTLVELTTPLNWVGAEVGGTVNYAISPSSSLKPGTANAVVFELTVRVGECCAINNTAMAQGSTMPGVATCERTVTATGSDDLVVTGKDCPCYQVPPQLKLVSWWPFDETTGAVANDLRAAVNNVGFYGPGAAKPQPVPGVVKGALRFDGVDDYVETGLPNDNEINFLGACTAGATAEPFTIDMWIKADPAAALPSVVTVLDKRVLVGNVLVGYALTLVNGRLSFQMNGVNFFDPNTPKLDDGQWHFIAVTVNRCAPLSQGQFYVDGGFVHTFTPTGASLNNLANNSNLYLGRRAPLFDKNYFKGALDELEFFKTALSGTELGQIYAAGARGKCKQLPCDQPTFSPPQDFGVKSGPRSVVVDDFDKDGKADLAVANTNSATVAAFKNTGTAALFPPTPLYHATPPSNAQPFSVASGDFNKDGRRDVATARFGGKVSVLLNNGGVALFNPQVDFNAGFAPAGVAVGDFNKDNYDDLVVANYGGNNLSVLLNNQQPSLFNPAVTVNLNAGAQQPRAVAVQDLNQDGNADVAVANFTTGNVTVLLGTGLASPLFQTTVLNFAAAGNPRAVIAADLNADGRPDLLVACDGGVLVLLNNGLASLFPAAGTPVTGAGAKPAAVAAADFNCDDKLDVVIGNDTTTNTIVVLPGKGDGTFGAGLAYSTGGGTLAVAVGDFNNDGRPDIAGANFNKNTVTTLLNECPCACKLPALTIQPVSQKICQGTTATFNAVAIGNQPLTVQWEVSTNGGATWTPISGATGNTYTTGDVGKLFRAVFTNVCGATTSNAVALSYATPLCAVVNTDVTRFAAGGGPGRLTITAPEDAEWLAVSSRDWLVFTSEPAGVGNGVVNYLVLPNPLGEPRAGTLSIAGAQLNITQEAATTARTVRAVAPSAVASAGSTITVPVEIVAQGDEHTLAFSLSFDPNVLSNPQATLGSGASSATLDTDAGSLPGRLGVTLQWPAGQALAAGVRQVLNVSFAVAANPGAASTSVGFDDQPAARLVRNAAAGVLPANFTAATITLARPVTSVSAASFRGLTLAPEEIVAAFGTGLATSTQIATALPLPTTLAGTTVKVRDSAGTERAAPLFFVSATQVNYLVPAGTATGAATVTVTAGDGALSASVVQLANVAPGLFTASASGRGVAAANALTFRPDGSSFAQTVARFDPVTSQLVAVPIDLGPEGNRTFAVLYGTGGRGRSSLAAVTALIGGVAAPVSYAGPQGGFAGLDQFNVEIPRALLGRGLVDVVLLVDGQVANTVQIAIK